MSKSSQNNEKQELIEAISKKIEDTGDLRTMFMTAGKKHLAIERAVKALDADEAKKQDWGRPPRSTTRGVLRTKLFYYYPRAGTGPTKELIQLVTTRINKEKIAKDVLEAKTPVDEATTSGLAKKVASYVGGRRKRTRKRKRKRTRKRRRRRKTKRKNRRTQRRR